jgi:hypothetical protein
LGVDSDAVSQLTFVQGRGVTMCVWPAVFPHLFLLRPAFPLVQYGNGSLRLTTRQTFQLHGVLKQNLKTVFSTVGCTAARLV